MTRISRLNIAAALALTSALVPASVAAQAMSAQEAEVLRAQVAALKAQVERLEDVLVFGHGGRWQIGKGRI